jgi:hypothetical protein
LRTIACVTNSIVENVVAAEAEYSVAALKHLIPDTESFIEVTESTGFAFIGHKYFAELDKFQPMQPYPSWTWSLEDFAWSAPMPRPEVEGVYDWNEESLSWVELELPEPEITETVEEDNA